MKLKDIIKSFSEEPEKVKKKPKAKAKAKPKAEPKVEINEEIPGLIQINSYARPFELTGTGILFPDGSVQSSAQGGSAEIDPDLVLQVQQNTSDIAKNAADIAAIEVPEIPEIPEIPDPIDAYTKAEVDASQAAQDETIGLKAPQETTYTKVEIDSSQGAQDIQIASKAPQATTYTKTEVDSSQAAQDVKIAKNLADIATNKGNITANSNSIASVSTRVTSNENDIIELEEEIEALAPSFDRGHWEHDPVEGIAARPPIEGAYYLAGDSTQIVQKFGETSQVYFHNVDSEKPPQTHTFDDVEVGMYIEMFEGLDSSFLLGVVSKVDKQSSHTVIDVTVVKAEGGPGVEDTAVSGQSLREGVRVKFFSLSEADLNLNGYMQTSGGTFTGSVKHRKEIIIEPTLPNRFVNIKNRYASDADGFESGSGGTAFGINFDLDHGNSGYNTVQFSNRDGIILAVNGGSGAGVKYRGKITDNLHIVNKGYVDNELATATATIKALTVRLAKLEENK